MDLVKILLAIFLPPLGVLVHRGPSLQLLLNILLTLAGWLPGVVHAFWVIGKKK